MTLASKKHIAISTAGLLFGMLTCWYILYSEDINSSAFSTGIKWAWIIGSGFIGIMLFYVMYRSSKWLDLMLPWRKNPGMRLLAGLCINAFSSLLLLAILYMVEGFINPYFSGGVMDHLEIIVKAIILVLGIVLVFSIVYFAFYSYQEYASMQIEKVKEEGTQIDLKLAALKAQLSPHFLFNSFNTITALIQKDVDKAEFFIRELANLYEYTLKSYDVNFVSLREELEFVKSYKFLIKTRFEQALQVSIHVPFYLLDAKVLPLTLQLLVENAIKHNRLGPGYPLHIEIKANDRWIWVRNNKTHSPSYSNYVSFRIGLSNIRSRYLMMTGRAIQVLDREDFLVKIPLVSN